MSKVDQSILIANKVNEANEIANKYDFSITFTGSMISIWKDNSEQPNTSETLKSVDEYLGFMRGWQSANQFYDARSRYSDKIFEESILNG